MGNSRREFEWGLSVSNSFLVLVNPVGEWELFDSESKELPLGYKRALISGTLRLHPSFRSTTSYPNIPGRVHPQRLSLLCLSSHFLTILMRATCGAVRWSRSLQLVDDWLWLKILLCDRQRMINEHTECNTARRYSINVSLFLAALLKKLAETKRSEDRPRWDSPAAGLHQSSPSAWQLTGGCFKEMDVWERSRLQNTLLNDNAVWTRLVLMALWTQYNIYPPLRLCYHHHHHSAANYFSYPSGMSNVICWQHCCLLFQEFLCVKLECCSVSGGVVETIFNTEPNPYRFVLSSL